MDMKSAFLNEMLQEVYVELPKGFVDPHRLNDAYKLKRALHGLKQAPQAWYDRLTSYLMESDFERGNADNTLFIRMDKNILLWHKFMWMTLSLALLKIILLNLLQMK